MDRRLKIRQKIRPHSCDPYNPYDYESHDSQDSHGSHNSHGIHKLIARLPKSVRLFGLLGLCLAACMVGHPAQVMAATSPTAENPVNTNREFEALPVSGNFTKAVGRYQFNYTGNINYYSAPSSGSDDIQMLNNVLTGYETSSMGTLYGDGNTRIVKAYLFWETRKRYNKWDENSNHVAFMYRANQGIYGMNIYPDHVYVDDRKSEFVGGAWANSRPRIYCNIADVTSIVQAYGYGDYYVANIPICRSGDLYGSTSDAVSDTGGGGAPGGWQLIVVEERDDLPVRAIALSAGSKFRFGNYDWEGNRYGYNDTDRAMVNMEVGLGALESKRESPTGQVLFGGIDSAHGENTKKIFAYSRNSSGTETTSSGGEILDGLYRSGQLFCPEQDMGSVLYNINSGLGCGDSVFGTKIYDVRWNTQLYIGAAIDIAFPDFTSTQTTMLSDGKAIINGTIKNASPEDNTGIYNGELTVVLDQNLSVENYSIVVNGNSAAGVAVRQGTITDADGTQHNTITFYGGGVANFFRDDVIEYTIICQISGYADAFYNRDQFNGYLRSAGTDTGYWINKAWTSSSHVDCKYNVTANANGGTLYDYPGTNVWTVTSTFPVKYGTNLYDNIGGLSPKRDGYQFNGWYTNPTGGVLVYDANGYRVNNTGYWKNGKWVRTGGVTVYAHWTALKSNLKIDPNGGKWNGSTASQTFNQQYLTTKAVPDPTRTGYNFKGWTKSNPFYGSFANKVYTYGATPSITDTLTASWQAQSYTLSFDANGGTVGTKQATITYDSADNHDVSWNMPYLKGHTFLGWYSDPTGGVQIFNENGLCANEGTYWKNNKCCHVGSYTVYAHWKDNEYTIQFDPNGGGGTDIPAVTVHYGETFSFPNGNDYYKKYTLDGVNVTQGVLDGTIDIDGEVIGSPDSDPHADRNAYASIYRGWGLETAKGGYTPQWQAYETISVASLVEAAGVTDVNGGSVTLYAIWDDCPWILASDRYFTLNEAHNGVITEEEMFKTAKATDTEDGDIPPGENFILIDFDENELLELPCEATLRVIYQSTDSQGSIYKKSVYIHVIDDLVNPDDPDDPATSAKYQSWVYPRFINAQFFQNADGSLVPEEKGGVAENSVWRTDSAKTALLSEILKAERTGQEVRTVQIGTGSFDVTVAGSGSWTSVQNIWEFTPEDVERSKEFVKNHGWANYVEADGLAKWLQEFDDCKKK